MLKVIAYTGCPSGDVRVRQYIEPLKTAGIAVCESPSWVGAYPPTTKWQRPLWGLANVGQRAADTIRSYRHDVVFLQREMLSSFVTWEPFTRRPRIFDVDDAIWLFGGNGFARRLAALCDHVICGNDFLADQFSEWSPSVSVLPSPVNAHSFCPRAVPADPARPIIGWMGLSHNLKFLYGIERALGEVLRRHRKAVLRVVSNGPPRFRDLPGDQVEYVRWTPENQTTSIREMTLGIMPLDDSPFSRGKCAYKMLLYMASGLPVVVSPVGMNAHVLQKDCVGFGARNQMEWAECLHRLLRDPELCARMGQAGRQVILQHYSVDVLAPQLAKTLWSVAGRGAQSLGA